MVDRYVNTHTHTEIILIYFLCDHPDKISHFPNRLVNSEANARRILTVENCFGSSGEPLSIPGRVLVSENYYFFV